MTSLAAASSDALGPGSPALYAAALAGLPGMGPRRLLALLRRWPPEVAWERVLSGQAADADTGTGAAPRLVAAWRDAAKRADLARLADALAELGVRVLVLGDAGYPGRLAEDPDPPGVVFVQGSLDGLDRPCVAMVGTRRCTPYGREVAAELGRDLTLAGATVVSGLAIGVDGAAHEGALVAPGAAPVGVVGSGLDVVYPRRHARLWARVAEAGAVVSEAPLGARPEAWRFPLRNRIVAGLADLVVVVESHARGGSHHTVDAAVERGRTVMAVPGSVRSPASAGTNALIAEGAVPVRDAADVLVALGLGGRTSPGVAAADTAGDRSAPERAPGDAGDRLVLDALGWEPATLDLLVERTGSALGSVVAALSRLEDGGWVGRQGGCWRRLGQSPARGP